MENNKMLKMIVFMCGLGGLILVLLFSFQNSVQRQSVTYNTNRGNLNQDDSAQTNPYQHRKFNPSFSGIALNPGASTSQNHDTESERLWNWKVNFPWKPTHDPYLKSDPGRYLAESKRLGPMSATDMFTGANHYVLKNFFDDESRFSPQFEKFYRILEENDRGHDPVAAAAVFHSLRSYYHAAYEHGENDEINEGDNIPIRGLKVKTWGQYADKLLGSLHVKLITSRWHRPGFLSEEGRADAFGLIERLLGEVEGLDKLPVDVMEYAIVSGMNSTNPEAAGVLSGEEELLVPYVGWTEEHAMMEGEQRRQFQTSYEQGDPFLKAAMPELFPPVDIINGQLVDKDGDLVKWSESGEIALINERGERVPVVVEDDGNISLPTPEEVELMRQSGDVRPATLEEASPIIQKIMEMSQPPK